MNGSPGPLSAGRVWTNFLPFFRQKVDILCTFLSAERGHIPKQQGHRYFGLRTNYTYFLFFNQNMTNNGHLNVNLLDVAKLTKMMFSSKTFEVNIFLLDELC